MSVIFERPIGCHKIKVKHLETFGEKNYPQIIQMQVQNCIQLDRMRSLTKTLILVRQWKLKTRVKFCLRLLISTYVFLIMVIILKYF